MELCLHALRPADTARESWFRRHGGSLAGAGHRRQHGHFQNPECHNAAFSADCPKAGDNFTNPIWERVRDNQRAFSGTLAFSDFLRVLGVPAMRGRVFTPDDGLHGGGHAGPVAVISYERK